MGDLWFNEWADNYLAAIGHSERSKTVMLAMKTHIVYELRATPGELGEVLARQLAAGRVPQFPAEVPNALVRELRQLREERAAEARPDVPGEPEEYPECHLCGGSGLVVVPVPKCVWQGRVVCYPGTRRVATGAVLCDAPGCEPGQRVREREGARKTDRPRPTYLAYIRRFGGLDVASLLKQHERDEADAVRRRGGPSQADVAAAIARLGRRVSEGPTGEAA